MRSINRLKSGGNEVMKLLQIFITLLLDNLKYMYIIAVYDCGEKRVAKMLKLFRKYLNWIQNSVFEGELSEVQLKELKIEAAKIMDKNYDSVIFFSSRNQKWLDKEVLGREKNDLDNFL
jgi:CRISPR-associated protein Cas2